MIEAGDYEHICPGCQRKTRFTITAGAARANAGNKKVIVGTNR